MSLRGISAEACVWSSPHIDWSRFDTVVLRSCWDYHLRLTEFLDWIDRLETLNVGVLNPPSLVKWNSNKRYLLDVSQRGIATMPTVVVAHGRAEDVQPIAIERGWSRIVVKPVVSASGFETYALNVPLDAVAMKMIARVAALGDVLVQPFAEEVANHGEYSLTFIEGAFSHAAIKRAGAGEFRVQTEHGGSVDRTEATPRASRSRDRRAPRDEPVDSSPSRRRQATTPRPLQTSPNLWPAPRTRASR
jgi:glutathione synthase/RimK-type ligase-like ATP-grasp enzyme